MREIGSEFWEQYDSIDLEGTDNEKYLLSGRTALQFIIDDILLSRTVKSVLLPSYCCESMIIPFVKSGMTVQFYHVDESNIDYFSENDADIVLLLDYFGYEVKDNVCIARESKLAGKIVIYDATHKINGNPKVQEYADYSFCSFRKWFYCNCAKVTKHQGSFLNNQSLTANIRYNALRELARAEKEEYINGITEEKSFLAKFGEAEQLLEEDYVGYSGISVNANVEDIILKRKRNASFLMNELSNVSGVKLWKNVVDASDTPLFVPILVDSEIRDDLRRELISKSIYCPVHWPKSPYHNIVYNALYDMEISLICDQRYDLSDMKRISETIKEFLDSK